MNISSMEIFSFWEIYDNKRTNSENTMILSVR